MLFYRYAHYIDRPAARTVGRELFLLRRHMLPNTLGPLVVLTSGTIPSATLDETALSCPGMDVAPTGIPSWDRLLADGGNFMIQAPGSPPSQASP
jgi:ABC-type dipeptide/oligopeptide/nickel transport system permease subunit